MARAFNHLLGKIFPQTKSMEVIVMGLSGEILATEKIFLKKSQPLIEGFKNNMNFLVADTNYGPIVQGYINNKLRLLEGKPTIEQEQKYSSYKMKYYNDFREGTGKGFELYIMDEQKNLHFVAVSYDKKEYRPGLGSIDIDDLYSLKKIKFVLKYTDIDKEIENSCKIENAYIDDWTKTLPKIKISKILTDNIFKNSINYKLSLIFKNKEIEIEQKNLFAQNTQIYPLFLINTLNFTLAKELTKKYLKLCFFEFLYQPSLNPFPYKIESSDLTQKKEQKIDTKKFFEYNFYIEQKQLKQKLLSSSFEIKAFESINSYKQIKNQQLRQIEQEQIALKTKNRLKQKNQLNKVKEDKKEVDFKFDKQKINLDFKINSKKNTAFKLENQKVFKLITKKKDSNYKKYKQKDDENKINKAKENITNELITNSKDRIIKNYKKIEKNNLVKLTAKASPNPKIGLEKITIDNKKIKQIKQIKPIKHIKQSQTIIQITKNQITKKANNSFNLDKNEVKNKLENEPKNNLKIIKISDSTKIFIKNIKEDNREIIEKNLPIIKVYKYTHLNWLYAGRTKKDRTGRNNTGIKNKWGKKSTANRFVA